MSVPRTPLRTLLRLLSPGALLLTARADLTAIEQQILPEPEAGSFFASDVAHEGSWLVVGSRNETEAGVLGAGAVYTYSFDGSSWVAGQRLVSSQVEDKGHFGTSVALAGDCLAVGQRNSGQQGSVHLFRRSGSTWSFEQVLTGDTSSWDEFGHAVDMVDDRLVVGATRDVTAGTISGAAYVFRRDPSGWVKEAVLTVPVPASLDWMGYDLDLDGSDRLIVGAYGYGAAGSAFVFERCGTTWTRTAQLDGPSFAFIGFGTAVQLEGTTAVVGASSDDTPMGINSGSVYVHHHDGSAWQIVQQLVPPAPSTAFGSCLALQDGLLFVDEITIPDHVRCYGLQPSGWVLLVELTPSLPGTSVYGSSLSLAGTTLLVGSPATQSPGAVYVYDVQPAPPTTYCTSGTSASGCTALIASAGQASASTEGPFQLLVTEVEGSKRGLFYWSPNGRQASPWGTTTSFQCVVPPVSRGALLTETGTQGLCDGAYAYDLHARWAAKPSTNPGVGATVQAQFWHRDPFGSPLGTSLSNALEFTVAP